MDQKKKRRKSSCLFWLGLGRSKFGSIHIFILNILLRGTGYKICLLAFIVFFFLLAYAYSRATIEYMIRYLYHCIRLLYIYIYIYIYIYYIYVLLLFPYIYVSFCLLFDYLGSSNGDRRAEYKSVKRRRRGSVMMRGNILYIYI